MCQIWYAVKRCSLHALPVTELALHLPDIGAFPSGAHAAACRKIPAACGDRRSFSSSEESFFDNSLSLHICGLQFLLSFLLHLSVRLKSQPTRTRRMDPLEPFQFDEG